MNASLNRLAPHALSLMRIVFALMLLQHPSVKFLLFPMGNASPPMFGMFWWAGVIETIGGVLLLIGLFSRPVAFVLAGHLAAAYFIGHAGRSFYPIANNGEVAVLFCFGFLYMIFSGPGPWSLDRIMGRE